MSVGCTRGCPAGVRPGTPSLFCVLCCMCVPRPSLGVQGALVARLLDPLPFSRAMLFAHDCSLGMDARSGSLRLKGKGSALHPTNLQRSSALVQFHDQAGSSSPMGRASWPPHERCVLFCKSCLSTKCLRLAVPSDDHRPRLSGRCRRSVVAMFLARFRRNRLLSVSPHCYGRTETQTAGSSVCQL